MPEPELSGAGFADRYISRFFDKQEYWYSLDPDLCRPLNLTKPENMNSRRRKKLTKLLCNWTRDERYAAMVSAYVRDKLSEGSDKERVARYLERSLERGVLAGQSGLDCASERRAVIALAFALERDEKGANELLRFTGYDRLYARSVEDASVIFALNNGMDLSRWQAELKPICDRYRPGTSGGAIEYLWQLRRFVAESRRPDSPSITLDLTSDAHDAVSRLRGGPEVLGAYLETKEAVGYFSGARERARIYLCRALLREIDRQIARFLTERDKVLSRRDALLNRPLDYDRSLMADLLAPLWVFGKPDEAPPGKLAEGLSLFRSPKSGDYLTLGALSQYRDRTAALTPGHFDLLRLTYSGIRENALEFFLCGIFEAGQTQGKTARPAEDFSSGDGALGFSARGFSRDKIQQLVSGLLPISRPVLVRMLVFLGDPDPEGEGLSAPRLDGMLIRAGFSPLDPHNADDALMLALLDCPGREGKQRFLEAFVEHIAEGGISFPCLKLAEGAWHRDFL
ncbi:hypothetical protein SDC9_56094 [bioreactor metagenome]|uniref:Uncharacterized protein n=1 Tax=bioreactor metagenome TaxID=1076179 RepID=A0A644X1L5_9ZZZZ